jgi:hypothetical protein
VTDLERLIDVVDDLLGVLHLQAEEVQRLMTHVEQQTIRSPDPNQLPLVLSELSELRHRVHQMAGASETGP